jgi:hypothetical protein
MTVTWIDNPKKETDILTQTSPAPCRIKIGRRPIAETAAVRALSAESHGIIAALRATRPAVPSQDSDTQQPTAPPAYTGRSALQYRYAPHNISVNDGGPIRL